jgi:hypothetical protein
MSKGKIIGTTPKSSGVNPLAVHSLPTNISIDKVKSGCLQLS